MSQKQQLKVDLLYVKYAQFGIVEKARLLCNSKHRKRKRGLPSFCFVTLLRRHWVQDFSAIALVFLIRIYKNRD